MLGEIGGLGPLLVLVMGGLAAALPWLLGLGVCAAGDAAA